MAGIFSDTFWYRLIKEFDSVGDIRSPRSIAVIGHLMTEIALNDVIDRYAELLPKRLINQGFDKKVIALCKKEIIYEDTRSNLITIDRLRNAYAHIRNPEDLDPRQETIEGLLKQISQRRPKKDNSSLPLSHRIQNAILDVLLDHLQEDVAEFEDVQRLVRENTLGLDGLQKDINLHKP